MRRFVANAGERTQLFFGCGDAAAKIITNDFRGANNVFGFISKKWDGRNFFLKHRRLRRGEIGWCFIFLKQYCSYLVHRRIGALR